MSARPPAVHTTGGGRRAIVAALAALLAALLGAAACGGDPARPDDGAGVQPLPPTVPAGPYVPGTSYTGAGGYIEYLAGDAPVILAAAHGGGLTPPEMAERGCGVTVRDLNTRELARAMQASYLARTGRRPHVVLNHLARSRLDANRDSAEAICGDPRALVAWREWHAFLGVARAAVVRDGGRGWFMDLHGHAHPTPQLELGYLLANAGLALSDAGLDAAPAHERLSSIRTLGEQDAEHGFAELLRGPASLGALYAAEGYPAVPSPATPGPGVEPYFSGGENTQRYGCADGGRLCGVQLEAHYAGVRDTDANRAAFAAATARVLDRYLAAHWSLRLTPAP